MIHRRTAACLVAIGLLTGGAKLAASDHLTANQRECLVRRFSGHQADLPLGKNDAFALMDAHAGRILWFRNPAVLARRAYSPGSIFKLISAYAALNRKRVDPGRVYRCRGGDFQEGSPGHRVHCWLRAGHGPVNLSKALALSCNLYFADLGTRLGTKTLLAGARDFGLGRATGSDLPGEIAGSLPEASPAEQAARLAVGQGERVAVTPLQVLSMAGALANGGILFSPRTGNPGRGATPRRGTLAGGPALRFLQNAMEEASTFGTGSAEKLGTLRLAGKTGTSAWKRGWKTHAWYLGFAPARRPLVALVVFVHDGQGSKEAARLAHRVIATAYLEMTSCGVFKTDP